MNSSLREIVFKFEEDDEDKYFYNRYCALSKIGDEMADELGKSLSRSQYAKKAKLYVSPINNLIHDHLTEEAAKLGHETCYHASSASKEFHVYSESLWEIKNAITALKTKPLSNQLVGWFSVLKLLKVSWNNYNQLMMPELSEQEHVRHSSILSRHIEMASEIISYNQGWVYVKLLLLVIILDIILFKIGGN